MRETGRLPIMCDTDSIYAEFNTLEQLKAFPAIVQQSLGNTLYNLEYEGTYDLFMMSKSKKSYIKIQGNKLTIKGLAWSKYTTEARDWVKQLFRDILISGEINNTLHKFYHYHLRQILASIETGTISGLRNYARLLKLGGKSNEVKYIKNNYDLQHEDVAYVIAVKPNRKNQPKAELLRPIYASELDLIDINVQALMNWLMAGVTKLIAPMKCGPSEINEDTELVHYRTEKLIGTFVQDCRDMEPIPLAEYCQLLQANENTNTSVHELFTYNRKYRMFLDVDHTNRVEINQIITHMKSLLFERINIDSKNTIIVTGTSNNNKSFHILFNVRATLIQMKRLAKICKRTYKAVDTEVYALGKSLRSPLCAKIDRIAKSIDYTSVHYPVKSDLMDCIIHNIENTYDLVDHIQDIPNMLINTQYTKCNTIPRDVLPIMKSLLNEAGITYSVCRFRGNMMSVTPLKEFKCTECNVMHQTHNPYVIYARTKLIVRCSLGKTIIEKQLKKIDIIDQLKSIISNTGYEPQDYRTLCSTYFDEPLPAASLVAINSSVGTGKSVWLQTRLDQLPSEYKIVCVSFRRSFTRAFCESYKLDSYLSIQGTISLDVHPRIMIQCDSLHRLELGPKIDLLILDEAISIISQLNSGMIKNAENVYQIMHCLLVDSKQIIAMDALLYPELAMSLSKVCNCQNDFEYIENAFKPYAADVPFKVGSKENVIKGTYFKIKELPKNAKVAAFISSYMAIKTIYINLVKDGRKVLMLHGKDLVVDQALPADPNKLVSMKELKIYWFEHLSNIFTEYDVFLYTSTITAGISIDKPEIDLMLGCYIANTCSPLDFVQGMFRVRKRKNTEIYFQPGNRYKPMEELIPELKADLLSKSSLDISGKQELQIMAECMTAQLEHQRDELTIQFLQQSVGFKLQLVDINKVEFEQLSMFETLRFDELYNMQYIPSEQDIKTFESIQKLGGDIEIVDIDDLTYAKGQWISILRTYHIDKTPEKIFNLDLDDIKQLYYYRAIYANQKNRLVKYELEDLTDYNHEKYEEITNNIVSMLNRVTNDQMLVKTDPKLQKHLKDQRIQELLNIIAAKFKETPIMSNIDLNTFLTNLDSKFGLKVKLPIKHANLAIMTHGYKIQYKTQNRTSTGILRNYELVAQMKHELEEISQ